ncbi:hypothetical protein [Streptomyces sp. 4N124]|uniref:hypothetical protein n=1 Tax=Streptomyces sp. 4N124 TaxID=3457420 RepID=UPI003FD595D0
MPTRYRLELGALVAVAGAFTGVLALAFATAGQPNTADEGYLPILILWSVFAAPSLIATHVLCRAWWRSTNSTRPTAGRLAPDGPARLLATAVAVLPEHRRSWGAAMSAELAHVPGGAARWRFAAGCARAALFPPSVRPKPVLAAGVLTVWAVLAVDLAVGQTLPAMRLFAVTFAALVGALVALALARGRRVGMPVSGPAVTAVGLAGVVASVALTAHVLARSPAHEGVLSAAHAVVLSVFLAGCLGVVLVPPRSLTTSPFARRAGLATALTLAVCFLLAARRQGDLWAFCLFLAPIVVSFTGSTITAALRRSFRTGIQTTAWTALLAALLLFVVWLAEALHWYGVDGRLLLDGETGYPVGVNVKDAVFWVLVFVPVWGLLPFGILGAALGARLPRLLTLLR